MELTKITDIRDLLSRHDFKFSKSIGQNFLIDKSVPTAIVSMSGISKEHGVLEIGPGIGALTSKLCETAEKVVAIELDRFLLPILHETLSDFQNLKIIHGDALNLPLYDIVNAEFPGLKAVACANLPYYITTPAISALIESKVFDSITVMVQKEVAHRICAKPATREYGAFSIFVNYHASAEILFGVSAGCFIPAPKVDSAVILLRTHKKPPVELKDELLFKKIVRATFNQRRKTFVNAAIHLFAGKITKSDIVKVLSVLEISENARGETFSIETFAEISNKFYEFFPVSHTL